MGEPAEPFEQLMAVLPKQSAHALPPCYRSLLSDPNSEIIDFYPIDFRLDVNGARYAWMGVNLLPFIDRSRLVKALKKAERNLTERERERNSLGNIYLFVESTDSSKSIAIQTMTKNDIYTKENSEITASYKRLDNLGGIV